MKCPEHPYRTMELTNWRPGRGLDQKLREFWCKECHMRIYKCPTGFEGAQEEVDAKLQNSKA